MSYTFIIIKCAFVLRERVYGNMHNHDFIITTMCYCPCIILLRFVIGHNVQFHLWQNGAHCPSVFDCERSCEMRLLY